MSTTDPWTIDKLLTWTAGYFADNGSESPRLDAEVLLSQALGCQRIDLYARFDQVPVDEQLAEFRSWVKRRSEGEPVAYLVGEKEFYSLPFVVSSDVLIPRPETEGLIVETLDLIAKRPVRDEAVSIADVGTGSGIIAVTLAKHAAQATIVAFEISEKALDIARRNAERHGVTDRIDFRRSDLMEASSDETFDFVVSNPPYIGTEERETLPKSVVDFEPEQALFSGADGTETIARLVQQSGEKIAANGFLLVEISPNINEIVLAMIQKNGRFGETVVRKDTAGLDRIAIAQRI